MHPGRFAADLTNLRCEYLADPLGYSGPQNKFFVVGPPG
jgi:hypothetical protein